jgi:crotonobetainyl-CoA:carnitine CoA-transferase CaiB-like acyl-CoA transferase
MHYISRLMGPLENITVVDLSERSVSAAMAGMMLADYGARVVRVEPAGGDPIRALKGTKVWFRGQESVTAGDDGLDHDELTALCRSADIVIDTAQAWTAKSFSYGPPVPEAQVYCLLTAEPARAEDVSAGIRPAAPVYGELSEAKYGFMYVQDGVREPPIFIGVPHAAVGAAWLLQIGVLGALYARERTGKGQVLTTSLADALAILNNWRWVGGGDPPLEPWPSHSSFNRFGNARMILAMLECTDGWIQLNTGSKGASNRFLELIGREDLVDPVADVNVFHPFPSQEVADEFWEFLPREFKKRSVQEWWELLEGIDVSAMPVLEPGEALSLEQTIAQGLSHRREGGAEFGLAGRFERTPGAVGSAAPRPGADDASHRDGPVRVAGRDAARAEHESGRGPLEGIVALDLGAFVAGPFAMRLLADLGARVITVERPALVDGDIPGHSMSFNRGKESICVDVTSEEGRRLVLRLVEGADVVSHNMRFGVIDRLGLDYETIRSLNPRAVYHHASGYGNLGPWAKLPVFGPMPDALSGAYARAGGSDNPPLHTVSHADFGAGLNAVPLVLAALIESERSGRGQFVETPQLGASLYWMSDTYVEDGETVETFALDSQQRGHAPTNALYPTRDGWILLACYDEREWAAAHSALGAARREPYAEARRRGFDADDAVAPLAQALASLDTSEALSRLSHAGVACIEPRFVAVEMLLHGELTDVGPLVRYSHPLKGDVFDVGRPWRFSDAPDDPPRRPPVPGEHSRSILDDLGLPAAEVEQLLERGVVAQAESVRPVESR